MSHTAAVVTAFIGGACTMFGLVWLAVAVWMAWRFTHSWD